METTNNLINKVGANFSDSVSKKSKELFLQRHSMLNNPFLIMEINVFIG